MREKTVNLQKIRDMKRYIYIRCSTDQQSYTQQMNTINTYFAQQGIDPASITAIYEEKEHGDVEFSNRKLAALVNTCQSGDYIYVSELSRLGRSMSDIFNLVTQLCAKGKNEAYEEFKRTNTLPKYGAVVIQCKDNTQIESESVGGKAVLFALSLAAELELSNIRQRTQSAINVIKANLKENGSHVSNKGNVITHLGNAKGCDTSAARAASAKSKREKAEAWRNTNVGYMTVMRWVCEGRNDEEILSEFNHFHRLQPEKFSTPKGKELTQATLKAWRREFRINGSLERLRTSPSGNITISLND